MNLYYILFGILSILAIASALVTVTSRHPVKSAMALVVHFFMLAGLYLSLDAQFVAVMQIIVYAGAIMVLVVFVIMLLNLGSEEIDRQQYQLKQFGGIVLSATFGLALLNAFLLNAKEPHFFPVHPVAFTTAQAIGQELFTNYLVQFEAIGILLTAAIIGAVTLAKRKLI